jgi:hypothetical protein
MPPTFLYSLLSKSYPFVDRYPRLTRMCSSLTLASPHLTPCQLLFLIAVISFSPSFSFPIALS